MANTIVLIHGRSTKPTRGDLEAGWLEAVRHGLERDHPAQVADFNSATIEFIYYGDINNAFLDAAHDTAADAASRKETLDGLKAHTAADFDSEELYRQIRGKYRWYKVALKALSDLVANLHLGPTVVQKRAPDMVEYWNLDSQFGSDVRFPIITPLKAAMDRNDRILVISHSLGTMIAYDTFWKFSRMGEYRPDYTDKPIDLWVTLGSPLGDRTVKRHLKGAGLKTLRRYPSNVGRWINFAAKDDYVSHDARLVDDYQEMIGGGLTSSIDDYPLLNLALRNGHSNPHHAPGYLIHPKVAQVIADWL